MIHQNTKDIYYVLFYPVSKVLRPLYQLHYKSFGAKRRAQIGSGLHYMQDFVNIDANFRRKTDYLLDVRAGLPFPDNSIEFIYSCHMLEHLYIDEAVNLLRECKRVLTDAGYVRLTLPDFEYALQILEGQATSDFPRRFTSRHGQAINHMFCDGQHRYAFSQEVIQEMAAELGFSAVERASGTDVNISNLKDIEPGGSFSVNIFK